MKTLFGLGLFGFTAFILLLPSDVRADACTGDGKVGFMLGQIQNQCGGFRLTERGSSALLRIAGDVGRRGDACINQAKVAALSELGREYPEITEAAEAGDQDLLTRKLCAAIYLQLMSTGFVTFNFGQ
ncbi:hypothetical protein [Hyphomicrobium sp. NDB2Meth4]|uniref:hypothetical protein n=1 Tax=Hyphomicrobium sp. NDB2Meth4 TaxID=1892846 RepID=UPI0009306403|nr:hypothetical protein [Hyphomicrobium sp. NDB2Meth4]